MDDRQYKQVCDWIDAHFDELVCDVSELVRIPSVATYDDPDAPYGKPCADALHAFLALGKRYGFHAENEAERCGALWLDRHDENIAVWGHLDVVPPSDGWTLTQPFEPLLKDGWLIGRGADDNKGSLIGGMYALRALHECGVKTKRGLILRAGCDEEHGMRDVAWHAANVVPDKLSVIADCGFPVCHGEKGILEANIVSGVPCESVVSLTGGAASNIVPASADMVLNTASGELRLHGDGLCAHSAFPENGVNAIRAVMLRALESGALSERDAIVIRFMKEVNDDYFGTALGIAAEDADSGYTTCVGTMTSLRDGHPVLHLNIRYCVTADSAAMVMAMAKACEEHGCRLEVLNNSAPNRFPREDPVIDAMTGAYNRVTGENRQPYVMGGGTYARKLPHALGFGMGGLPREMPEFFTQGHGGAHQPDEGLHLANLRKGIKILALALTEADRVME